MTESDKILCKLIRIAFGNEKDLSLPDNVDWNKVMEMSFKQDVSSLTVDAYQKITAENPGHKTSLDSAEFEDLKYDWFGQNLVQETEYAHQWKIACKVCELFSRHGIDTYMMKGFSISRHYPVPEHRSCCDVDCFLLPKEGSSLKNHEEAFAKGNELIARQHIKVKDSFYKNSTFIIKGVMFENHRYITPVRGEKQKKLYEKYLQSIIVDSQAEAGDLPFHYPSPLFLLLFTLSHARSHFLIEGGISLRHVCDWAALMQSYSDSGLWDEFIERCFEFGFQKFLYPFSQAARFVCGVQIPFECPVNAQADGSLLYDILNIDRPFPDFSNSMSGRIKNTRTMLKSSWKFKLYTDTTMIRTLSEMVKAYFFEKHPVLSL